MRHRVGAFVHLNSGSPVLTVTGWLHSDGVEVSWRDGEISAVGDASSVCFYLSSEQLPIDIGE